MTSVGNDDAIAASARHGWVELDEQCVLSFRGSAVRAFLGRQLTCDIKELSPAKPLFGAWLTPKGRVFTLLRLLERVPGEIDALVPVELAEELLRRLRMFVMRDDVKIEIDSGQRVIGLWGDCSVSVEQSAAHAAHLSTIQLRAEPPLAMLVGSPATLQSVLAEHKRFRGSLAQWQRLCVEAGLPHVGAASREAFIPQMMNLDRLDAVSFSKGCYPGQEIVARTQHLGRIKRRMFIARAASGDLDDEVQPGDVIVGADGADIGGRILNVANGTHDTVMLAILPLGSDDASGTVHIHDASGPVLSVSAPPYSLFDPPH